MCELLMESLMKYTPKHSEVFNTNKGEGSGNVLSKKEKGKKKRMRLFLASWRKRERDLEGFLCFSNNAEGKGRSGSVQWKNKDMCNRKNCSRAINNIELLVQQLDCLTALIVTVILTLIIHFKLFLKKSSSYSSSSSSNFT